MTAADAYSLQGPVLVGHPGYTLALAASEGIDPCFDQCVSQIQAGVVAAGTALAASGVIPEAGLYWVEFVAGVSLQGAFGYIIACECVRATGGGLERVDILLASDLGGTERSMCLARIKVGGQFILRLLTGPTQAAGTVGSLIRWKRVAR